MSRKIVRSSSRRGAFKAVVENGRVVGTRPFERDPHPTSSSPACRPPSTRRARAERPFVRKVGIERHSGAAPEVGTIVPPAIVQR